MKQNKTSTYIFYSIFLFLPVTFPSGPFLPDFLTSIMSFIVIYFFFKNKIIFKFDWISIFFIFFYFIVLAATLASYSENTVFGGYIFYIRYPLSSIFIFYIVYNNPNIREFLFYTLGVLLISVCLDCLVQYFFGKNILGYERLVQNRISGVFRNEYIVGKFLLFSLPIFSYLFFTSKSPLKKIIFYTTLFLSSLTILLSGERTPLILLIFFLTFYIFIIEFNKFEISLIFLITILTPVIILKFDYSLYSRLLLHGTRSLNFFLEPSMYTDNLKHYHDFFVVSIDIFYENIFIGVGPKMYRIECIEYLNYYEYACSTHPHNYFLQLLSETGIFGFLCFFSIFIFISCILIKYFINKFFRKKRIFKNSLIMLIFHFFLFLFPFAPSGSFFNNWMNVLYFFPLGFLLYEISISSSLNLTFFNIKLMEQKIRNNDKNDV